jgi:hypothetical protein
VVVYLEVVQEYKGIFVISMDDSLIIKECGLDPRRRIREADSIRTAG